MSRTSARVWILTGAMSMVSMLALISCKGVLDATDRDAVTGDQLGAGGASVAPALLSGTAQKFATAYDNEIGYTGVIGDELTASLAGGFQTIDQQGGIPSSATQAGANGALSESHWNSLHAARVLGEQTYDAIKANGPVASNAIAAEARVYSAMSYLFLGEYSCDVAFDGGPALQPVEAIKTANTQLTEAIAIGTAANLTSGSTNYVALARLMRARAEMDLGQQDAAEADAALVPDGFSWLVYPVVKGGLSFIWSVTIQLPYVTTGPDFQNTGDPRVPVQPTTYAGSITPVVTPLKYPTGDTPLVLGNWQEARLIQAEMELNKGNTSTAISLINQVRAATAGLAAYPTTATPAQATQFLRTERGNALFLQARRLLDEQRWGLQPPEFLGSTPFAKICIPIPQAELNNNANLGTTHTTRSVTTFTAP